eukprot:3847383-Rhodomonas_salina.1
MTTHVPGRNSYPGFRPNSANLPKVGLFEAFVPAHSLPEVVGKSCHKLYTESNNCTKNSTAANVVLSGTNQSAQRAGSVGE